MYTCDLCILIEVQEFYLYGVCNDVQLLVKSLTMAKSALKKVFCELSNF
jgi:hypothetical protein